MLCIRAGRECQTTATVRRILLARSAAVAISTQEYMYSSPSREARRRLGNEWDAAIHEAARDGAAGDTR